MMESVVRTDDITVDDTSQMLGAFGAMADQLVFGHYSDHRRWSALSSNPPAHCTHAVLGDWRDVWIVPIRGSDGCLGCFFKWRYTPQQLRAEVQSVDGTKLDWPSYPEAIQTLLHGALGLFLEQGGDGARKIDLAARTVSDHKLLRHPLCEDCIDKERISACLSRSALAADDAPLHSRRLGARELVDVLQKRVIDLEHGLVRSMTRQNSGRIIPVAAANGYDFGGPGAVTWSFGRTANCSTDWVTACLEAVERFCGTVPDASVPRIVASYEDLGERAIDPRDFILPSPDQIAREDTPCVPFDPGHEHSWVEAYSFKRDGPVLVPMQMAYYGLGYLPEGGVVGPPLAQETSNGCALGGSMLESTLYGLLELLERDAFLRCWYGKFPVECFAPEQFDLPFLSALAQRVRAEGYELDLLELPTGTIVHAFAARLTRKDSQHGPAVAFLAGAHFDPLRAVIAAATEVAGHIPNLAAATVAEKVAEGEALLAAPDKITTMDHHADQCWPEDAIERRNMVTRRGDWDPKARAVTEGLSQMEALELVVGQLSAQGIDVLVVDQSNQSLARSGLFCAKVQAPGLLSMTFGHRNRRVSTAALNRCGQIPPIGRDQADLDNLRPHPFL